MNKCWICGEQANSSEHKIKRSDIIQSYGKQNYQHIPDHPVHYANGILNKIPGSNSKHIKYSNDLCSKCNNETTQPFDKAYKIFSEYIYSNRFVIENERIIDLREIYGYEFELQQKNLFKYFVKALGCRINDAKLNVPSELIKLFFLENLTSDLKVSFSIHEKLNKFPDDFVRGFFQIGYLSKTTKNGYLWQQTINYLTINYYYLATPELAKGYPWFTDDQFIYLGSIENFTQDEWNNIITVAKKLEEND